MLSRKYAEGCRWSKVEEGEKGSKVGGILEEAVVANQLCSKLDARSTPLPRLAVGLRIITEPHKVPDALASSSIDQHNNVGCRRPGRDQPGFSTRFPLLAKFTAAINNLNMIEAGKTITGVHLLLLLVALHNPPDAPWAVAVETLPKAKEIKTQALGPRDRAGHPLARRHPGIRNLWN